MSNLAQRKWKKRRTSISSQNYQNCVGTYFPDIRKYDTGHISDIFYDLDMMELDTASFLYFLHENLSCLNIESQVFPSLGEQCMNTIQAFKRDKLHILPLKAMGKEAYNFYSVSYESYMRQQAYPHIQFCTRPFHYFNYHNEVPFCLILDLHTMIKQTVRKSWCDSGHRFQWSHDHWQHWWPTSELLLCFIRSLLSSSKYCESLLIWM